MFVGTIQIQKRQQLVTKTRELKDMKDDLYQCQQEQGDKVGVGMSLAGSCVIIHQSLCMCSLQKVKLSHKCMTYLFLIHSF